MSHTTILTETHNPVRTIGKSLAATLERILADGVVIRSDAYKLIHTPTHSLHALCSVASHIRERGKSNIVTFSPKVFIPLTRLCRDFCNYCTFRQAPHETDQLYMTTDQILDVARLAETKGCVEALFTLGERPEQRYPEARAWLMRNGYKTTIEYLLDACKLILQKTNLIPHVNPGTLTRREFAAIKEVSGSAGIMLESISETLCRPGGPHEFAPSKWPRARLKNLKFAGQLKIPFTTGLLIGIGETREERIDALYAIQELHRSYGHIQEVIIQNFRAKLNTCMAGHTEPTAEEILRTIIMARLILGENANIQIPPNLNPQDYSMYLQAGINDWGGISPVTIDYVNPEAPWPHIRELERRTRALGFELRPRLPVYPEYLNAGSEYLPDTLRDRIIGRADPHGYLKGGLSRYVK